MTRILVLVCVLHAALPARAAAWGFDVHRYLTDRAIDRLPTPIRAFFAKHRVFLTEHAIDPDLWRNAGFADEPPRHFLDLDAYGSPPFDALPRDYDEAVRKFGREQLERNGLVPWRSAEMYGKLTDAFRRVGQGTSPYALDDVKFFATVLGHYVADAHVPFHAVSNHDGQLTNQRGIHARFETELFARYRPALSLRPPPLQPVGNVRDLVFDRLVEGVALAGTILEADRRAAQGRSHYDAGYFDAFFEAVQPILQARMAASIGAIASIIAAAWEEAGRPELALEPVRRTRPVPRPQN